MELSYLYKFGRGSAVYQGANRYNIKNITFQQHKIELKSDKFFVKAYTTLEDAGDAYDVVFTGIGLSRKGFVGFAEDYLSEYFDYLRGTTNEFADKPRQNDIEAAREHAFNSAYESGFLKPGTPEYKEALKEITGNPDLTEGSKFSDQSKIQHIEGQYNLDFKKVANFNIGASFRNYSPQSKGTIFRDTMLADGTYENLNTWETGGYIQGTFDVVKDKLKLIGSVRADKHMNFDLQWSPRVSAVFSHKNHSFRVSAQSAFRSPTLQNQYILLDLGVMTIKGNLDGVPLSYTLESVNDFRDHYEATNEVKPNRLKEIAFEPLKQEQVKSIEGGYRGIIKSKLFKIGR